MKNVLTITIASAELYDEENNIFKTLPEVTLDLEHSLLSVSKWESTWHKPFLSKKERSRDEEISYIKCMTLTENVSDSTYGRLSNDNISAIDDYINDSQTALYIPTEKSSDAFITSEYIYYWMAMNNIPFECEKWHLNRLLALIYLCGCMNTPEKKRSESEIIADHRRLNQMHREALHTKG